MLKSPDFFILGAQKAGTTSLFHYLKKHPQIYFPSVKEPHFFNKYGMNGVKCVSDSEYLDLYKNKKANQLAGDASPSYLTSPNALSKIEKKCKPDLKFVVLLRQPIERAYSNFQHARREGIESETSFEIAIQRDFVADPGMDSNFKNYVRKGFYARHLKAYFEVFGKDKFVIIFTEALNFDPKLEVAKVLRHLNLDTNISIQQEKRNKGREPRFLLLQPLAKWYYRNYSRRLKDYIPKWSKAGVKALLERESPKLDYKLKRDLTEKYYYSDIMELQELLGCDLQNWLK